MRNQILLSLAAALALGVAAPGCGGDDDGTTMCTTCADGGGARDGTTPVDGTAPSDTGTSGSDAGERIACGGFAGLECPDASLICVDDPGDDCDPDMGGSDCIGICVPAK